MKSYKIELDKLQAVLDYLSRQPYAQVVQLINMVAQLEEIPETSKEEKKNEVQAKK